MKASTSDSASSISAKVNRYWWRNLVAEAFMLKGHRPEEELHAKKAARA
jgi:hypothetical protein